MLRQKKIYQNLARLYQLSVRGFSEANKTETHYETLGLSSQASKEEIKKAYKQLSKQYHPDVSKDPDAAERFKKINHAYSVLKDKDAKSNYDQQAQGYEKESASTHQYTAKKTKTEESTAKTNGGQARSSGTGASSQGKTPEEVLYEKIFGKSFREDPMYFYKEANENLRKEYEEELNRLHQNDNTGNKSAKKESNVGNNARSREDQDEWEQFMNDVRRERWGGQGAGASAATVQYPQGGQGVNSSALKWILGGVACLGGISLYLALKGKSSADDDSGNGLNLGNIRDKHLKREEDKKEKRKADFINSLALMKRYPRKNPDAISMLVDYTLWDDIKIYTVPFTYFHGEDDQLCRFSKKFEKSRLFNVRTNVMLTLALEAERSFKNVFVKIDDVLKSLKETGHYEPPGVFFRFYGFMHARIRRKPINVESLQEHIQNGEKVISVFDLFIKYSTPILIANSDYYEIPLKHSSYVKDTTTREGMGWVGNAHINHRSIPKVVLNGDEKNVFMWKGSLPVTPLQERYLRTWGLHYDTYEKL